MQTVVCYLSLLPMNQAVSSSAGTVCVVSLFTTLPNRYYGYLVFQMFYSKMLFSDEPLSLYLCLLKSALWEYQETVFRQD